MYDFSDKSDPIKIYGNHSLYLTKIQVVHPYEFVLLPEYTHTRMCVIFRTCHLIGWKKCDVTEGQ